jgi:hypothetical protein
VFLGGKAIEPRDDEQNIKKERKKYNMEGMRE